MPFRVHNAKIGAVYTVGIVSDGETDITSDEFPAMSGNVFRPAAYGDDAAAEVAVSKSKSKSNTSGRDQLMAIYYPPGVDTLGNESLLWVPAIVNLAAMTVAECTAAGALNVSMAVRGFSPTAEQGTSEDIRLGSKQSFENPGRVKPSIDDITYVYDPQAAASAPLNKHVETLIQGAKGYLVDIRGLDAETWVAAAGQKYTAYPVTLGAQRDVPIDPSAEGAKFEKIQKPFVSGLPVKGAIAA